MVKIEMELDKIVLIFENLNCVVKSFTSTEVIIRVTEE
jgi:hypothetical protein